MTGVSVSEAAKRLGVGVQRVHQRIADGSLRAERIGSQWVVDELSLLRVAENTSRGRSLSARSVWALVALASGDDDVLQELSSTERARARSRLNQLFVWTTQSLSSEQQLGELAVMLRGWFRNRAERRLYHAAPADLPGMREDKRLALSGLSAAGGIAAGDVVEGYVAEDVVERLVEDHLLVAAERDANVVLHVVAPNRVANVSSPLLLAADLAEHRGPREELRAAELARKAASTYVESQR
ncbi:MAG: helix-turn-helix domain-containing protein [Pseudonocardia sp.]|nr:helix-turn-helix domain-containing protein [Pseudonocardia sp.]